MNLNAIETAEALENIAFVTDPKIVCRYAGTMLRQQQAEIEALKSRKLTDEEIDKAIEYATMQGYGSSYIDGLSDGLEMANAILRKASEK